MIRAESPLAGFQTLLMQKARLGVVTPNVQQVRQIVHARKGVDMIGSESLLPLGKGSAKQFLRGKVVSAFLQGESPFFHFAGSRRGGSLGHRLFGFA